MKRSFKKFLAVASLAAVLAAPAMIHADGVNFSVKVGEDDEAHFHFKNHRHVHPLILKAANQLRNAKHTLWEAADDFNGHKAAAVQAINTALDELRIASEKR